MKTFLALVLAMTCSITFAQSGQITVYQPGETGLLIGTRDATTEAAEGRLIVQTGTEGPWPGVNFRPEEGPWDLSGYERLEVELENLGDTPFALNCKIESNEGGHRSGHVSLQLEPGVRQVYSVPLRRVMSLAVREKLYGMRGYPCGYDARHGIATHSLSLITLFVTKPKESHRFAIGTIRAIPREDAFDQSNLDQLFPMIDKFGQYRHKDWPGKVRAEADLAKHLAAEEKDLAANPGPGDRNEFGGWTGGPQLEATGRFRTEKVDGKWWLVDPSGRLYWSHGVDCVRLSNATTPITDRKHYFAELPEETSPFLGRADWAPHGYYQGKGSYKTFNFTSANLKRKYGDDWAAKSAELAHRRLRSWGINTIANWSDPRIYLMRQTPYTTNVGARGRTIAGSEGYWGKFPDPFDPSLADSVRNSMKRAKERGEAGDRWNVGYFVSNELAWGNDISLAQATIKSPADQPAKRAMREFLEKKYTTIEAFNEAWGTQYASWQAWLDSTALPPAGKIRPDLQAFYTIVAEKYFEVCRDGVKAVDPEGLYLGCRFAWVNDRAVYASAKYCDLISFNRYKRSIADFTLPGDLDLPCIIGEFHFGALDRGMLHTGLVPTASQDERAVAYRSYVQGAIDNRLLVGTHWFTYGDQATTGRGDGENYQIGFLDVCDTPYPETIKAVREVGKEMYNRRFGKVD